MNTSLTFKQGMKDSVPTMFGYIGIGIAFGIIGRAAGFSTLVIFLLSAIVYAGSAQFVMLTLLATHSPMISVILSVFLVNSRMFLLSLTTAPFFKEERLLKNVLIGSLLTDESFALGMNKQNYTEGRLSFAWFNAANIVAYLTWSLSSVVGAVLSGFISHPERFGLDFAVVAMFIGLLYLQMTSDRKYSLQFQGGLVLITLILFYFGLIFIPSGLLVLVVTIVTCGLGVFLKNAFV